MASCKECIHAEFCFLTHKDGNAAKCEFKDRSDIVEVVRCKDCKHRKEKTCFNPCYGMWVGCELKDDDFCSYGERKDNG